MKAREPGDGYIHHPYPVAVFGDSVLRHMSDELELERLAEEFRRAQLLAQSQPPRKERRR